MQVVSNLAPESRILEFKLEAVRTVKGGRSLALAVLTANVCGRLFTVRLTTSTSSESPDQTGCHTAARPSCGR